MQKRLFFDCFFFFLSLCIDMFARRIAWGVQWLVNVRDSREGEASLIPVVYSL